MDEKQVKAIIQMTIDDLLRRNLLERDDAQVYKQISERLSLFFSSIGVQDDDLQAALDHIRADKYRHIIWMFYRDGCTVDEIAERLGVDSRTVSRNKKRLCLEIYRYINK